MVVGGIKIYGVNPNTGQLEEVEVIDGKLGVDTEFTIEGNVVVDKVQIKAPGSISDGSKDVTTAGTAVPLSSSTTCLSVNVQAKTSNSGAIYVGGSSVDNSRGAKLLAGDSIPIDIDNLNKVYIDSDNNGDGVTYTYVVQ